jgi:hypothetical protein
MYQNGTQTKIKNFPGDIKIHSDTPVTIGGLYGLEYFPGLIDDVRIYNRALSASEITDLYNGKEVSTEGLVGWWAMNEGEDGTCTGGTDVCDLSGNANHGTNNGATWLDGRGPVFEENTKGYGLEFNGRDWVNFGDLGDPGVGSISLWFKKYNGNVGYLLEGRTVGNWWLLTHYDGADINFYTKVTYNGTSPNTWYHLVVTSDLNESRMYVDGELVDIGESVSLNFGSVRMATRYTNASYLDGQIDDVRIYNRALRPEEIRYLYETTYRD